MAILADNEFQEVEGRQYEQPQVALDETNAFIDNLRATQTQNTQQISTDTQRLGTDIPTNLGGLTGAQSYWTSRYQTPQTASSIADLRAINQAKAMNDVLATEQAIWKKRYQDAYRAYQKSAYDKANNGGGGGGSGGGGGEGEVPESPTDRTVGSVGPSFSPLDYSGEYVYNYKNKLSEGLIGFQNNLTPSNIKVTRDSDGNVISMTMNGKTFTGDTAQQRFDTLYNTGNYVGQKVEN